MERARRRHLSTNATLSRQLMAALYLSIERERKLGVCEDGDRFWEFIFICNNTSSMKGETSSAGEMDHRPVNFLVSVIPCIRRRYVVEVRMTSSSAGEGSRRMYGMVERRTVLAIPRVMEQIHRRMSMMTEQRFSMGSVGRIQMR